MPETREPKIDTFVNVVREHRALTMHERQRAKPIIMQTVDDHHYYPSGTMPPVRPPIGMVLVHNHVAHTTKTSCGVRGFRAWLQPSADNLEICNCGWSGLDHYKVKGK